MRLKVLAGLAVMVGLASAVMMPGEAMAYTCPAGTLRGDSGNPEVSSIAECNIAEEHGTNNLMKTINDIINVVLGALGIVAVVVIIIGGIGFVTSQGDAARVTKARNTILYGVVGLVVALLAFAIVNFVLKGVSGTTTGGSTPPAAGESGEDGE